MANSKIQRLRLLYDPRFIFCIGAVILFFLVTPREPGCYLNYWITPWGRMTILFAASALLWVKSPVTQLLSMALCALAFSTFIKHLSFGWDEFILVTRYWYAESGISGVVWFVWKDAVVSLFSLLLFCYGMFLFARAWIKHGHV